MFKLSYGTGLFVAICFVYGKRVIVGVFEIFIRYYFVILLHSWCTY